jgi:protein xylosyltransferase
MMESKPPSPGSASAAHAHRRWAAPLLASVLLSSLLISASLFFSSSRALLLSFSPLPSAASAEPLFVEAKLRQHHQQIRTARPHRAVPRIAYLVSGSAGDGVALRRTLRALYHPGNRYVVHLDLEAPAAERAELAAAVRADPVYSRFRNVKVVTRANLVTYRGPTMVANTLHAAAILLRDGGDWDWFINLSASDYPLVSQDGKRRCDLLLLLHPNSAIRSIVRTRGSRSEFRDSTGRSLVVPIWAKSNPSCAHSRLLTRKTPIFKLEAKSWGGKI